MKRMLSLPIIGLTMVVGCPIAQARQVVVLPGVVGPVGVVSGVDTQGPGALTVGNQNINTSNDVGGGITTDAANTANIVFTGNSTVTGTVGTIGSTFTDIAAGANGDTVTFNGPVYSTTASITGTGTVNFNGGFISNTASTLDFAGDGFINVGAGQTVKAAITNSAGARTGTLTLNGGSIVDGAVGAASGLKQITVAGGNADITGQANAGIYTLGVNTLNVGGALAIPVAGTINTTIFSHTSYGKIVPVGFATVGSALQVNVAVTGPIANGTSFNIVDATSGTTGSTVTATDSNSTRYTFSAAPTTNGLVRITTTQVPLADVVGSIPPGAIPGVNPIDLVAIAPIVDLLPVNPTTNSFLTAITLLPNAPAVAAALNQLVPGPASLVSPQVNFRATQRLQDLWASHLEAQEACGVDAQPNDRKRQRLQDEAVCQSDDMRSHWWVKAFDLSANQGDVNGFEGYSARTQGAMLAYDAPIGRDLHGGLGLRYARSTIGGNTSGSNSDVTSYQATAYLGYAPGPWYLNGALAYGSDKYSAARHVVFPGVDSRLNASYSGSQLTGFATTGYHVYLGDGRTVLTPYASLQLTDLRVDGYSETGDNAIGLNVAAQKYDFAESTVGVKLTRDIALSDRSVFKPEMHANWLHGFGASTMANTATFESGGAAFTVSGLRPDGNTYDVGAGLALGDMGRWSVEAVYDYLWQTQSYRAHQLMINVAAHF